MPKRGANSIHSCSLFRTQNASRNSTIRRHKYSISRILRSSLHYRVTRSLRGPRTTLAASGSAEKCACVCFCSHHLAFFGGFFRCVSTPSGTFSLVEQKILASIVAVVVVVTTTMNNIVVAVVDDVVAVLATWCLTPLLKKALRVLTTLAVITPAIFAALRPNGYR